MSDVELEWGVMMLMSPLEDDRLGAYRSMLGCLSVAADYN